MSWSLLRLILDRFWVDFGSPNGSQTDQKSVQKGIQHHVRFWTPSRTSKNRFLDQLDPNLTPERPPRGRQERAQNGPKTVPKRSKIEVGSEVGSEADLGPILDRFGTDSGPFWNRFRSDFRLVFDRFLVEAPQLAFSAYMLVCIYAIMQKCMHTLMKCTTSLGHGESSMQKGGAPVTRPVGVLDNRTRGWFITI